MKQKRLFILFGLVFAGLIIFTGLAAAQTVAAQAPAPTQQPGQQEQQPGQQQPPARVVTDNDVNRVAKKLYCPVCPNTPLDVCETQACKDWRAQIREQLSAGWTEQQVMDFFVKQYGERVLAEPERGGFTSLVWMLPVLVALIGLVLVWLILRRWLSSHKRSSQKAATAVVQQTSPATSSIPRDVLAKIEAEIRQMD